MPGLNLVLVQARAPTSGPLCSPSKVMRNGKPVIREPSTQDCRMKGRWDKDRLGKEDSGEEPDVTKSEKQTSAQMPLCWQSS